MGLYRFYGWGQWGGFGLGYQGFDCAKMFLPQTGHSCSVQGLVARNDFAKQAVEDAQMLLAGGKILLIGAHSMVFLCGGCAANSGAGICRRGSGMQSGGAAGKGGGYLVFSDGASGPVAWSLAFSLVLIHDSVT